MKAIIIQIDCPKEVTYEQSMALDKISDVATKLCKEAEGAVEFQQYCWLFPLERHLPFVGRILSLAESASIPFRYTYLNELPEWHDFNVTG